MNDTYEAFHEYFELVEANSTELLEEVYRLRYRVYCLENNFEDLTNYPDGMEKDEYDYHSVHMLLKHRPSGCFVGTVRMVFQDALNPKKKFPVEKFLQIDPNLIDVGKLPRQHVAEISRFAIVRQFSKRRVERRKDENRTTNKKNMASDRRRFPFIGLALVVGIVRMCAEHNVDYWLSAMDPSLNRLLSFYGSSLYPVGPLINYHGKRRPYYIRLIDVLNRMHDHHHDVWELVTDYGKTCPYSMEYIQPPCSYDNRQLIKIS